MCEENSIKRSAVSTKRKGGRGLLSVWSREIDACSGRRFHPSFIPVTFLLQSCSVPFYTSEVVTKKKDMYGCIFVTCPDIGTSACEKYWPVCQYFLRPRSEKERKKKVQALYSRFARELARVCLTGLSDPISHGTDELQRHYFNLSFYKYVQVTHKPFVQSYTYVYIENPTTPLFWNTFCIHLLTTFWHYVYLPHFCWIIREPSYDNSVSSHPTSKRALMIKCLL